MSALGKLVLEGDFDTDGQMVVQTPVERVIERSVVVTRTVQRLPGPSPRSSRTMPGTIASRRCPIRWRRAPSRLISR